MFPAGNKVAIRATDRRPAGTPDYYVILDKTSAARLGLGSWAVLVFQHPALAEERGAKFDQRFLAVHCRVSLADETPSVSEPQIPCVAVDQTLRNALGIPFRVFPELSGGDFYLLPANRLGPARIRRWLARIFAIRYLAVRCQSAHVTDIEKNYVRVHDDVLKAVGIQEAANLVIERPLAIKGTDGLFHRFVICEYRISGLAASDAFITQREKLRNDFPKRYPDAQKTLYNYKTFNEAGLLPEIALDEKLIPEPDVPPIFMDAGARSRWGAKRLAAKVPGFGNSDIEGMERSASCFVTPLIIRRSISSALLKDALQTGFAFALVLIQFTIAMDLDPGRVSGKEIAIALVAAAILSLFLLVARLRQQV